MVTVAGPSRLRAEVVRSVLEEPYLFTPLTDGCVDYVEIFDGRIRRRCTLSIIVPGNNIKTKSAT